MVQEQSQYSPRKDPNQFPPSPPLLPCPHHPYPPRLLSHLAMQFHLKYKFTHSVQIANPNHSHHSKYHHHSSYFPQIWKNKIKPTRVSIQPRRSLGEYDAQIPNIPFEETDQNSGFLGSESFWVLSNWSGRFHKTHLGNNLPTRIFNAHVVKIVVQGRRWGLVEAELVGQGHESLWASKGMGGVHEFEEWWPWWCRGRHWYC